MIHYAVAKKADKLGITLTEQDTEVVAEKDGVRVIAESAKEALDTLIFRLDNPARPETIAPKRSTHAKVEQPSTGDAQHEDEGSDDTEAQPEPASRASKVHPRYKELYGKDANCGDDMALELKAAVVDPESLASVARDNGIDPVRWSHLNFGMQRMNLGNSLRRMLRKGEQVVVGGRTMQIEAPESEDEGA
jgi:hypothetical protein